MQFQFHIFFSCKIVALAVGIPVTVLQHERVQFIRYIATGFLLEYFQLFPAYLHDPFLQSAQLLLLVNPRQDYQVKSCYELELTPQQLCYYTCILT